MHRMSSADSALTCDGDVLCCAVCGVGSVSACSQRSTPRTVEGHSGCLSNVSSSPSRSMASGEVAGRDAGMLPIQSVLIG